MFCKNCRYKLDEGDLFCPKCGTKVEHEDFVREKEETQSVQPDNYYK